MSVGFVLLADGTAGNKVVNENRESWPPEVTLNNSLSAEAFKVT